MLITISLVPGHTLDKRKFQLTEIILVHRLLFYNAKGNRHTLGTRGFSCAVYDFAQIFIVTCGLTTSDVDLWVIRSIPLHKHKKLILWYPGVEQAWRGWVSLGHLFYVAQTPFQSRPICELSLLQVLVLSEGLPSFLVLLSIIIGI